MYQLLRTDSSHPHYRTLVAELDKDLAGREGQVYHDFYAQYNKSDDIKHVIVAYHGETAVGIGAIKHYADGAMEVKRMYVPPAYRGKGVAPQVLAALEEWAKELGYAKTILETGKKMPEAIGLYKKSGYIITPNYGQYAGVDDSVCFEKFL